MSSSVLTSLLVILNWNFRDVMTKAVSKRDIYFLLKQCYYCANMACFTKFCVESPPPQPPNTIRVSACSTYSDFPTNIRTMSSTVLQYYSTTFLVNVYWEPESQQNQDKSPPAIPRDVHTIFICINPNHEGGGGNS